MEWKKLQPVPKVTVYSHFSSLACDFVCWLGQAGYPSLYNVLNADCGLAWVYAKRDQAVFQMGIPGIMLGQYYMEWDDQSVTDCWLIDPNRGTLYKHTCVRGPNAEGNSLLWDFENAIESEILTCKHMEEPSSHADMQKSPHADRGRIPLKLVIQLVPHSSCNSLCNSCNLTLYIKF